MGSDDGFAKPGFGLVYRLSNPHQNADFVLVRF